MELSNRLRAVAELVTAGSVVCDVGCDHGYVPIYLVRQGICKKVIAMDINAGPLHHAQENIKAFGLDKYIVTRLSDGVSALESDEADCLILAGLGGNLAIKILETGAEKIRRMKELILQPQSDIAALRKYLRTNGFAIIRENMVYEGKYYPMIKVTYMSHFGGNPPESIGAEPLPDAENSLLQEMYDKYGYFLLREHHPILYRYLLWEQERENKILENLCAHGVNETRLTEKSRKRKAELEKAEKIRECALSCFEDKG